MKAETHLYEMVYQSMLTQFYNGTLRCGHSLPSQQELCRQYNIGITTIRKVMRMLEENGFIRKKQRWRDNGGRSSLLFKIIR